MTRVLFICHGNICRSPMAEFVMRDLVEKAGLFRVTRHVLAPDPEAFITEPVIPAQRWEGSAHRTTRKTAALSVSGACFKGSVL